MLIEKLNHENILFFRFIFLSYVYLLFTEIARGLRDSGFQLVLKLDL